MADTKPSSHVDAPLEQIERSLIDQYLRMRGYEPHAVSALPAAERDALLKDASIYASSKLCEVESRSHFVHELHDAIGGLPKAGKA